MVGDPKQTTEPFTQTRKERVPKEAISRIPQGQWVFAGIIVCIAYAAWFAFYAGTYEIYTGLAIWGIIPLAFFLLAVAVGLSFFLLRPAQLFIGTYAAVSILPFVLFGSRGAEALAVCIFFFTTYFGYLLVKREQKLLLPFLYSRILRQGMPIFFSGLAFALAFFYHSSPAGQISQIPQIPKRVIDIILIPAEYALKPVFGDFQRDMKLKDVVDVSALRLPNLLPLPQSANVPPELFAKSLQEQFVRFPEKYEDKTVAEFLFEFVNTQLNAILLPYQNFIPFLYLFSVFMVFKAIGIPLMWLSIGAGWVVSKMLRGAGIIRISKSTVEKEELIL